MGYLEKNEGTLLIFMAVLGFAMGDTVYEVGDSAGWSVIGNVDYAKWTSSKTFQVNDTLLFKYDPQYHNVVQVTQSDFRSCDATAPIATYYSGNDSFVIRGPGHYYFFCGFVGHCQAGQKVDIRVLKSVKPFGGPAGSPNQQPQASPDVGPVVSSPSTNGGESVRCYGRSLLCGNIWLFLIFLVWDLF